MWAMPFFLLTSLPKIKKKGGENMRIKGILLNCNIVKKIDSKYCAIAKFFDIEKQKLHQLYFLKDNCNDETIEKLLKLKNKQVEIEVELPYNLVVTKVKMIEK